MIRRMEYRPVVVADGKRLLCHESLDPIVFPSKEYAMQFLMASGVKEDEMKTFRYQLVLDHDEIIKV